MHFGNHEFETKLAELCHKSDSELMQLLVTCDGAGKTAKSAALHILMRRAVEGDWAVIASQSEDLRQLFAVYGFDQLERYNGAGVNRLRTDLCANPGALREGDVLADGDKVLSAPREGGNGRVLIHLTGGHEGHWVAVPGRIPVALQASRELVEMKLDLITVMADIHDYFKDEKADRTRGRATLILTLLGNLRHERDEARRERDVQTKIKEAEKLILLKEVEDHTATRAELAHYAKMADDLKPLQPARNADEWGKRLSEIAMMRIAELEAKLAQTERTLEHTQTSRDDFQRQYLQLYREKHPQDEDEDRSGQYASGHP
jgi:hypothetical protein